MIVLYILLAVVILLCMVLIHEFGHYIAGKILKFKITEFSVGFGFPLFSRTSKKTGEKFSLRIFPLGGYCSFYGEDDEEGASDPAAFNNQKPWKRIIVFFAGVTANFLTAIIFSWILLCTTGYDVPQINRDIVYGQEFVQEEGYYNEFKEGDIITHINGKKIDFAFGENFVPMINSERETALKEYQALVDQGRQLDELSGEDLHSFEMTVKRDGKSVKLTVYVYPDMEKFKQDDDGKWVLSNTLTGMEYKAYVYNAWEGFCRSFEMAFGFAWVVLKSLWMLITFQIPITEMGGTVATISTIATMASQSMSYLLVFIPLIAANLAVFNILPFPALDGAHVLFTTIEWIRGKPINRNVESMIHFVGLIILFLFVIVVDILHFVL